MLPEDSPYNPAIRLIIILLLVNVMAMVYMLYAGYKFIKRVNRTEERQIKILNLSEGYAELGEHRREEAKILVARLKEDLVTEIQKGVAEVSRRMQKDSSV